MNYWTAIPQKKSYYPRSSVSAGDYDYIDPGANIECVADMRGAVIVEVTVPSGMENPGMGPKTKHVLTFPVERRR